MKNKRDTVALLIGGVIEDHTGILRKRTSIKDDKSAHADNYYYIPTECYCNKASDTSGHTYNDEYGPCDYCESMARQVNGNNTTITVDFNDQSLFNRDNYQLEVDMGTVIRRLTLFPLMVIGSPILYIVARCFENHKDALASTKKCLEKIWG